ncbi:MAG TPA: baseplate assembly protein [Sulfurovum sp. UBA12169]|nr:MAG TPA: baseplate assembly protein [Sulfurovum sp. UBA12169]
MIDINALPEPKVLQELCYETILANKIAKAKELVPDWQPLESDEFKMILEDAAYQELNLRAELNKITLAYFVATATGADLDNHAADDGIERLQGSKPYALYEFSLSAAFGFDVVIPKNIVLQDSMGEYQGVLLDDVTIISGETKANGTVELQVYTASSKVKTEQLTTTLPYVVEPKALEEFTNGADAEDDKSLLYRLLISKADKSTAGSEETYESFTLKADSRIEDVKILRGENGVVNVYYYSSIEDALITTRITDALNDTKVRPISDDVVVAPATQVSYSVTAQVKILPNLDTATVYANAVAAFNAGLESLKQIGTDITLSEINEFLKVDGVKEVVISSPAANIHIDDNKIGINDAAANTITFTVL